MEGAPRLAAVEAGVSRIDVVTPWITSLIEAACSFLELGFGGKAKSGARLGAQPGTVGRRFEPADSDHRVPAVALDASAPIFGVRPEVRCRPMFSEFSRLPVFGRAVAADLHEPVEIGVCRFVTSYVEAIQLDGMHRYLVRMAFVEVVSHQNLTGGNEQEFSISLVDHLGWGTTA